MRDPMYFKPLTKPVSKQMGYISSFKGIEINENPLLAKQGSASEMLNMVVDENSFLTLRPRVIEDTSYSDVFIRLNEYIEENDNIFDPIKSPYSSPVILRSYKLDSDFMFLVKVVDYLVDFIYLIFISSDNINHDRAGLSEDPLISILLDNRDDNVLVFKERDYFRFVVKGALDHYKIQKEQMSGKRIIKTIGATDGTYSFPYNDIFNYKLCKKVSGEYEVVSNFINVEEIGNYSTYVYSNFILVYYDGNDMIEIKNDGTYISFYGFYPDGFGDDGKLYILQDITFEGYTFTKIEPYIPTYKVGIIEQVNLKSDLIYEDLNILSDKYKTVVNYDESSDLDVTKFVDASIEMNPMSIYDKDNVGSLLDGKEIVYTDDGGYLYFLLSDATTASALGLGLTKTVPFYYYNYINETAEIVFEVRVYNDGSGVGLHKNEFNELYKPSLGLKDGNGRNMRYFVYDSATTSLIRAEVASGFYGISIHTYSISTQTYNTESVYFESSGGDSLNILPYYLNGGVTIAVHRNNDDGFSLFYYSYVAQNINVFIGQKNTQGNIVFADILPALDSYFEYESVSPIFYFPKIISGITANENGFYILSRCNLSLFTEQVLTNPNDETLTFDYDTGAVNSDDISHTFWTHRITDNITLEAMVDLTDSFSFTSSQNTILTVTNNEALISNISIATTADSNRYMLIRVNLDTSGLLEAISISSFFFKYSSKSPVITKTHITMWGGVYLLGFFNTNKDAFVVKVDFDRANMLSSFYQVFVFANNVYMFNPIYASSITAFLIQDLNNALYLVKSTTKPLEFTFAINNASNPIKIDEKSLEQWVEARQKLLEVKNTTLMGTSRAYYSNNDIFLTQPMNSDYLPLLYYKKAIKPIRFASSYQQLLGVIYEQNNIEYVSFVENPLLATNFKAHPYIPTFLSVEQRATDYLPNGHLVTYVGYTVYLNQGGLYALNFDPQTPQDSERKASLLSKKINTKLLKEDLSTAILSNSDPYILIMFPVVGQTRVYAYEPIKDDWYYWELPLEVKRVVDDNIHLRLVDSTENYYLFTSQSIPIETDDTIYLGPVEQYLDFNRLSIKWYWRSQPLALGSPSSRKQITDTYLTFMNPNANLKIDPENQEIIGQKIAVQRFMLKYYAYREVISEAPVILYEESVNIMNNLHKRTYLNRFKFAQIVCYNINDEDVPPDKVRLASISFVFKYLTGGK